MQFRFDQFSVDLDRHELQKGDALVPMERKNFDLLVLLLRNRDRVVSKEEIFESIWPGVFVTDASLSTAIAQIRKAIDDSGNDQKYIRTLRGKGFRFVAEVSTHSVAHIKLEPTAAQGPAETSGAPPTIAVLPFLRIGSSKVMKRSRKQFLLN